MWVPCTISAISTCHHDDRRNGIGRTCVCSHKTWHLTFLTMELKKFQIASYATMRSFLWTQRNIYMYFVSISNWWRLKKNVLFITKLNFHWNIDPTLGINLLSNNFKFNDKYWFFKTNFVTFPTTKNRNFFPNVIWLFFLMFWEKMKKNDIK